LGNAIVQMKDDLQRFTKENEESKEQFRQLADFMPQMVWTARPDGFFDYYNKQWYDYTGFKEGHDDLSWIPILHPDDVKLCMDTWYSAVNTGTLYHIEYRLKDKNTGDFRWFLGKALPIKDKDGNVVKWFGTCTDIHEQKTISESLEALVHERTEELKRSNDDLQQFAHVASHDLKEPLRKIKTFGNLLYEDYSNDIPEKGKVFLDKIQYAADRMSKMVEGVLNYSTINSGAQPFETINLNELINEIKNDLELTVLQKKANIIVAPLPEIKGINVLIHQLFYNLIINALKFSKENIPPLISITSAKLTRTDLKKFHGLNLNREFIEISIKDNGIGFNKDQAEKIFNIFTRLNSKDKYEGTGLGLALCKKIILRHRGFIYAEGNEGEGANFHVILPIK
ncbi:MAG TPA: ATP-binding protein, partial [Chitinophagaceae bacterium]|nr:ATP-binding protein [Chitinophagaceae bacterium]